MVFFARGRPAWIASIVLGVILVIVGAVTSAAWWYVAGGGFALFGIVFLILSFVSGGATD